MSLELEYILDRASSTEEDTDQVSNTHVLKLEHIPGLVQPIEQEASKDHDTDKQSSLPSPDDRVLILRRLSSKKGIIRRNKAIGLYQRELPEYTKQQQLIALQGQEKTGQDDKGEDTFERFPVLARLTKKLNDVRATSEMHLEEIVDNPILCRAMAKLNWTGIKILLTQGRMIDIGFQKIKPDSSTQVSQMAENLVKSRNLFVGINGTGESEVFVDPDWYRKFSECTPTRVVKYAGRLCINTTFYGVWSIYHKIRSRLSSGVQKSPYQIQKERVENLSTPSGD